MIEWLLGLLQTIAGGVAAALITQLIAPNGKAPECKPQGKHYRR